jgi:transcriptional regulator with XRE-family HTH domain
MRAKGNEPVDSLVGARIRLLRKRRKMSQAELGKALGVTGALYCSSRRGEAIKSQLTVYTWSNAMKKIAIVFGCLVTAMVTTSMNAGARDCPSGHYYRMSGRCADASGHKVYGTSKTVKRTYKKPQDY